jgi:hypothetical protein
VVSFVPLPWMTVFVNSAGAAFSEGIVTFGAAPKLPVAVTTLFVVAADGLDLAGDDELQPATATAASKGSATSAAARRIKNLSDSAVSSGAPAFWCSGKGYPD